MSGKHLRKVGARAVEWRKAVPHPSTPQELALVQAVDDMLKARRQAERARQKELSANQPPFVFVQKPDWQVRGFKSKEAMKEYEYRPDFPGWENL